MSDVMDEERDENTTYLYLYIEPIQTGQKAEKQIVPATVLKRFDYAEYKQDKANCRNKKFKIRLHSDGEKQNCYVLLAGDTYEKVYAAVQKKRYGAPNFKFNESVSDDSILQVLASNETEEDEKRQELLKNSKKARKRKATEIKKQKNGRDQAIIDAYMNQEENEELSNSAIIGSSSPSVPKNAQSDKEVMKSQKLRIKHLEHQLKIARNEAVGMNNDIETTNEADGSHSENTSASKENSNVGKIVSSNSLDVFKVHDKIYCFNKEQEEKDIEHDERGYVHLGDGVYCNPIAYSDGFKSKDPFMCLTLLSEGVYGLEDLSKRCVHKQKKYKK